MRTAALLVGLVLLPLVTAADPVDDARTAVQQAADGLAQGDFYAFIARFDLPSAEQSELRNTVAGLMAEADVYSSVDVVSSKTDADRVEFELDWYMQIKANGVLEQRRKRVHAVLAKGKHGWRFTSFSPISLFASMAVT